MRHWSPGTGSWSVGGRIARLVCTACLVSPIALLGAAGPTDARSATVRVRVGFEEAAADLAGVRARAVELEHSWQRYGAAVQPTLPSLGILGRRTFDPDQLDALRAMSRWVTVEVPLEHLPRWWAEVAADPTVFGPVVEPLVEAQGVLPNDPRVPDQAWFLEQIGAPVAWQAVRGEGSEVVVAVVDTGTDIEHPDLADNFWRNAGEISGNGIDDDGNGFVDDVVGWNFATGSGDPTGLPDQVFNRDHGTHVAGIVAAVTDNGLGVAGVGYNLRLMAINAADPDRDRFLRYGYDGILYAASMGASVINCSWRTVRALPGGGPLVSAAFRDFENDVCAAAHALGSLVVAAAGNDASQTVEPTPAFYPTVLAVTATRFRSQLLWSASNTGPWVDLAAPGEFIWSTISTQTSGTSPYGSQTGTSMSTAIVSAAAALVKVQNPDWSPLQLRQRLVGTADSLVDVDLQRGAGAGAGMVRLDRAVASQPVPGLWIGAPTLIDADADGVVEGGEAITLAFEISSPFSYDGAVDIAIRTEDTYLRTLEDQIRLPRLPAGSVLEVRRGLELYARESVPSAHIAQLDFHWSAGGASGRATHWVELRPLQATVRGGTLRMSAAANGKLGYANPTRSRLPSGVGLRADATRATSMVTGALILATGPGRVSDAVQAARPVSAFEDFRTEQIQSLEFERGESGTGAREQIVLRFNDNAAANRLGVGIEQHVTGWADGSRGSFVLSQWSVRARVAPVAGLHLGVLVDWSAPDADGDERVVTDPDRRMQWVEPAEGTRSPWAGVVLLEGPGELRADWLWAIAPEEVERREGRPALYDLANLDRKIADADLWGLLARAAEPEQSATGNVAGVLGAGPVDLPQGASTELVMAFAVAEDLPGLLACFDAARVSWQSLREGRDGVAPTRLEMLSCAPNPFNPSTAVRFATPDIARVRITIYDARGRRVRALLDEQVEMGFHRRIWDGRDDQGSEVASGVYFVQLRTADQTLGQRVVLAR